MTGFDREFSCHIEVYETGDQLTLSLFNGFTEQELGTTDAFELGQFLVDWAVSKQPPPKVWPDIECTCPWRPIGWQGDPEGVPLRGAHPQNYCCRCNKAFPDGQLARACGECQGTGTVAEHTHQADDDVLTCDRCHECHGRGHFHDA